MSRMTSDGDFSNNNLQNDHSSSTSGHQLNYDEVISHFHEDEAGAAFHGSELF